ncbi:unnamed protein product [Arctogadus glacialis]
MPGASRSSMRAVSKTTSGRRWKGRGLQRPSSVCCVAIFFHPTLAFHEQLSVTVPVFMKQLLSVCLSLLGFEQGAARSADAAGGSGGSAAGGSGAGSAAGGSGAESAAGSAAGESAAGSAAGESAAGSAAGESGAGSAGPVLAPRVRMRIPVLRTWQPVPLVRCHRGHILRMMTWIGRYRASLRSSRLLWLRRT